MYLQPEPVRQLAGVGAKDVQNLELWKSDSRTPLVAVISPHIPVTRLYSAHRAQCSNREGMRRDREKATPEGPRPFAGQKSIDDVLNDQHDLTQLPLQWAAPATTSPDRLRGADAGSRAFVQQVRVAQGPRACLKARA